MKVLYYADKHVCPFNEFSRPVSDGKTSLILEHERTYQWLSELILQEKPDYVVDLGDTAQTIGYLDGLSLTCISEGEALLDSACAASKSRMIRLIGNHDLMDETSRVHVLPYLTNIVSDIRVIDDFLILPYYRNVEDWRPSYEQLLQKHSNISRVLIHLDIVGAQFNYSAKNLCKSGYTLQNNTQFKVYAGHFHHPQQLGNITVVGSCMYRTFSDEYREFEPRGVLIEDTIKQTRTRVENPHTSIYTTVTQKEEDEASLRRALESVPHPDRTFIRVIHHKSLESVVDEYKTQFRGSRCVSLAEKKTQVVVPDITQAFDPKSVLDAYLVSNPVADELRPAYRHYAYSMVDKHFVANMSPNHSLKILGLHLENYSSYHSADVKFDASGLVYVDGVWTDRDADTSNGSGKSSLFESLLWCLTGATIQDCSADEVVNNQVGANCLVSVSAFVEDDEYQFIRTRKHKQYGDDFRIIKNGEIVSQGLTVGSKYLEQRLGIRDETTLLQTVFLVDGLNKRFTSLTGRARMEMIESIIRLESYDTLYDKIHKDLAENTRTLEALRQEQSNLASSCSSLEIEYQHQRASNQSIRESLQAEMTAASASVDQLSMQIAQLDSSIQTKKAQYQQSAQSLEPYKHRLDTANKLLQGHRSYIRELERDINFRQKLLSDKESLARGSCPTCLRPYTDTVLQGEIDSLQESLKHGQSTRDQAYVVLAQYESDIVAIKSEEQAASVSIGVLAGKIPSLEHQLSTLRTTHANKQREIETKKVQIASLDKSLEQMAERLDQILIQSDSLKIRLAEISEHCEMISYWDKGLSPQGGGCRLWLISEALNQLSEYTTIYASHLSDGYSVPTLSLKGTGNKLNLNVTLSTQGSSYKRSSSGERRSADLPLQFALGRLSSKYSGFSCNVMVLDEVDDKLDASARRRLVLLLNKIAATEGKTILLASHNKDIKSQVDRVWTVERTDGVSRLRYA